MSIRLPLAPLILSILAILLPCGGCATKKPDTSPIGPPPPGLLEDAAFMDDLKNSGSKGVRGIRIIAPASGVPEESAASIYALADTLGVVFPQHSLNPTAVPYHAASDETRLSFLKDALQDRESEVLWAMRGGYGASRLLPELARMPAADLNKKIFIGYSDMTFLHLFLQQRGWKTIHGSVFGELRSRSKDKDNFRILAALLAGRTKELRYGGLVPMNRPAKQSKQPVHGVLTGGNLTCLAGAAGTPWSLEALGTRGKILFLEDVKEPGYKIDRMLTQLSQSDALREVSAVLLGAFTQGDENTEFALERFALAFRKPVFRADIFGHGAKNYPLVFNVPAVIERKTDGEADFHLNIDAASLWDR